MNTIESIAEKIVEILGEGKVKKDGYGTHVYIGMGQSIELQKGKYTKEYMGWNYYAARPGLESGCRRAIEKIVKNIEI